MSTTGHCKTPLKRKGFSVYHRSHTENVPQLLSSKFIPGGGDMYGKGLYSTFCVESQFAPHGAHMDGYGEAVIKFSAMPAGSLIFDRWVFEELFPSEKNKVVQEIGGLPKWTPLAQLWKIIGDKETFAIPKDISAILDECRKAQMTGQKIFTAQFAYDISNSTWFKGVVSAPSNSIVKGKVNSIMFTGQNDGNVFVAYNTGIIYPEAFQIRSSKLAPGGVFTDNDRSSKGMKVMRLNILKNQMIPEQMMALSKAGDVQAEKKVFSIINKLSKGEKVQINTLQSLLALDDTLAADLKLTSKKSIFRLRMLLLSKLLNPNTIFAKDRLFYYFIDLCVKAKDFKLLDTFLYVGGDPVVPNRSGKSALQYCIEEMAENGDYELAIDWIMNLKTFDPMIRANDGHLMIILAVKRDLDDVAIKLMSHPRWSASPKDFPKPPSKEFPPYPTERTYLIRVVEMEETITNTEVLKLYNRDEGPQFSEFEPNKLSNKIQSFLKPQPKDDLDLRPPSAKHKVSPDEEKRLSPEISDEEYEKIKNKASYKKLASIMGMS